MRILLIDDEDILRNGIKLLLEQLDFDVKVVGEAANGADGLEKLGKLQPDYAFIDLHMPKKRGLELIKKWSESHISPSTKCVILTAHSEFEYAQQAVRYGISDFLLKPVDEEDLQRLFTRLEQKRSTQPLPDADSASNVLNDRYIGHPLVRNVLIHISKNYMKPLNVSTIAADFGITPSYLSTLFKKHVGQTIVGFLNHYRIDMAKQILLSNPQYKIHEISYMVGFNQAAYFDRVFKTITGCSPNEYLTREKSRRL